MCEFLLINKEKINSLDLTYFQFMSSQIKLKLQHAIFLTALMCACACARAQEETAPRLHYTVFHTLPHDSTHFTQGLAIRDGRIFESTGRYGFSALYEKDFRSGRVLRARKLAQNIFGEGITLLHDRIYQLSWRNGIGFIYDLAFQPLRSFRYSNEGWGLTDDGEQLIMSDGSARLYWLDAQTLQRTREITVRDGTHAIARLNELEYVAGLIYANVWLSERIAAIDAESGTVRAWLDLSELKNSFAKPVDWDESDYVLNGIAYDPRSKHFFVTGKCWPVMFEIGIQAGTALPQ